MSNKGPKQPEFYTLAEATDPNGPHYQKLSVLEWTFVNVLETYIPRYIPEPPVYQFRFNKERRWRADFAWRNLLVLVEIDGGVWSGGRHIRGQGFTDDCEKLNAAASAGYLVFRFTGEMLGRSRIDESIDVLRQGLAWSVQP